MNVRSITAIIAAGALLAGTAAADDTLGVAATPVPHAEILEHVKPQLAEQGVELNIEVFTDYVQPNTQVSQGALDANFFQHKPYLDNFNAEHGTDLVAVAGVHIEPFGAYSESVDSLDALPDGATIAIPNDPTNGGRALLLLHQAGVITLEDGDDITATTRDIADNPGNYSFEPLEAAMLPRVLNQVDLALINTNYALEAGLDPQEDALVIEGAESPYVNFLVAREDNADSDAVRALADALRSESVRAFIQEQYDGAVVPAF
ncbi:MetQ/NlpA family ABC transporter substrate-binding protein [Aquisalimonas lutea]|uniref:MetQ/NlpA family ABC transporter substrate-binding protein n=1 Tax=Aquisalimonas lutea TaxID=1327750 RepID=UPI0025B40BC0|nr:MetQ/NlpA family ABC transporter substrate-binding protein [Aquisalimonas lutea]MDN3519460.1 MetQ/NlpA family ABC transporter substrate-binding protein [Aquisalimonas lutea]